MIGAPISELTPGCVVNRDLRVGASVYTDALVMYTDVGDFEGFWYVKTRLIKDVSFIADSPLDIVLLIPSFWGKRRVRRALEKGGWRASDEIVESTIYSFLVFRRRVKAGWRVSMRGSDRMLGVSMQGFTFLLSEVRD